MAVARQASVQTPDAPVRDSAQLYSLLFSGPDVEPGPGDHDQSFLTDLRLDQIIGAVAGDREERELITATLTEGLRNADGLRFRQEIFRDLENPVLLAEATTFSEDMRRVRVHSEQIPRLQSVHHQQGWLLDAAEIYCDAVRSLAKTLGTQAVGSRGLNGFREFVAEYLASADFLQLSADADSCREALDGIVYQVRIKGSRVEVSHYQGEPDYSAEISRTFERFRQGAVKDYRIAYRGWPGMNHVAAWIAEQLARLFEREFVELAEFTQHHACFVDPAIRRFERELQFYLAYLDYLAPVRAAGLPFCYPELSSTSKDVAAAGTFDLALAARLTARRQQVVSNNFQLSEAERVFVVSGPNQGGKTTFARTFGQLHHLGMTGCPVPGQTARLFLPDRIFTHFEREEDIGTLSGKLEDDLRRIQHVLRTATADSIVIMNEIFTATTLADARFLGTKVLERLIDLDVLCVYVTFIDELASLGPTVVSVASTIVPEDPAERTYKVVRQPADGLAYALAVAAKHGVTYGQLRERIQR